MRKSIQVLLWVATAATLVVMFVVVDRPSQPATAPPIDYPWIAGAVGTEEDPNAREAYNLKRLASPVTGVIPADIHLREQAFAAGLPARAATLGKGAAATWEQRGPVNIGGRTRALKLDQTDETILLAGGVSGGVWRSTNSGTTWSKTTAPADLHAVTALAQDTTGGGNIWYHGTGERVGNSATGGGSAFFRGNGVYKSTDGGLTWSHLATTATDPQSFTVWSYVWNLAVDPTDGDLYAAAAGLIARSADGGSSWSPVLGDFPNTTFTDIVVTSTGIKYAGLSSDGAVEGVARSLLGTVGSWADITPSQLPVDDYDRIMLSISPADEDLVWALVDLGDVDSTHMLLRYDDATALWTDYTSYVPDRGGFTGKFWSQRGYDLAVKAHPTNTDIVYIGGTNLFRIDISGTAGVAGSGDTWIGGYTHLNNSFAEYANHHPDQHAIEFLPSNANTMYTGSDGGIHRTDNALAAGDGGVTWTSLNSGYYTTQFYTACMNSDQTDPTIMGGMQDNGTWFTQSGNVADPWTEQLSGDGSHCQITNRVLGGTVRYVSAQVGQTFRAEYDGGGSLVSLVQIDPENTTGRLFVHPFVVDASNEEVLYWPSGNPGPPATIWRTTQAQTVTRDTTSGGWTNLMIQGVPDPISALATSKSYQPDILYFGTAAGEVYKIDGASTASAPVTPTNITAGLPGDPKCDFGITPVCPYVSDIAVDPLNGDRVMVVYSNYEIVSVWYTTDGGTSWTNVEGNLSGVSGPSVRSTALMPGTITPFVLGTSTGLYSATSLDGGSTIWTLEGPSTVGNVIVDMVRGRLADGVLLAGTHANGVYSSTVPLAIQLDTFAGRAVTGGAVLTWTTLSETASAGFEIELRRGEGDFETLEFVPSSGKSSSYSYTAELPAGRYTFRLKQVDVQGGVTYSAEIELSVEMDQRYELSSAYPNPFAGTSRLDLRVRETQNVKVELYDAVGRRIAVLFDGVLQANDLKRVAVDGSQLSAGQYLVRVTGESFSETRGLTLAR